MNCKLLGESGLEMGFINLEWLECPPPNTIMTGLILKMSLYNN